MKKLIFTDLDGTFLNHDDYSFSPALEALHYIKENHIPLIFTTSKTKAEVIRLQQKVGIIEPFITENGAALFIPQGYQGLELEGLETYDGYKVVIFGEEYSKVLAFYNRHKEEFSMKGFSDMSIDEIMQLTGFDYTNASLAKQRDFTEPFILKNTTLLLELEEFAETQGFKILQGGRFFHLVAKTQDKGVAVKMATELFEQLFHDKVVTFGFGDSKNDIAMFENVDNAINIQNHYGGYVSTNLENIYKSSYQGSRGFNEMVLKHVC